MLEDHFKKGLHVHVHTCTGFLMIRCIPLNKLAQLIAERRFGSMPLFIEPSSSFLYWVETYTK